MPVWPICFCSICPVGADAPIRLPAARMPTSPIETPPSASAPVTASAARSTVSLSGCLPNLVIEMPRIQMSSLTSVPFHGLEAEADRIGAGAVGADDLGRQPDLHPHVHVLGVRRGVDHVALHARAVAVDDRCDE